MTTVVIAAADQSVTAALRSALQEIEGVRSEHVVDNTAELTTAVLRLDPDVVLVHDELGPDPVWQAIRDLGLRRPATSTVVVSAQPSADTFTAAMEAGARGLVALPVAFEELRSRVEAAAAAAQQMRQVLATSASMDGDGPGRARVATLVGAKGGVGVTMIATHLALDVVRSVPSHRVCLVDLDLEKGDVAALIEVRHRASIADVAKVSADLSARAVGDAMVVHESGLHLLLTPGDVRDVEAVTPRALREVVAVLRREYDLVLIDAGSHVTPAQATAVELADEVLVVTTPDVLALRGLRRSIAMWESLSVRKEGDLRVLVNRASRHSSVSVESVRQLTRAPVLSIVVPAMFRRLEPGLNARDPYAVREGAWWRALRAIVVELGLFRGSAGSAMHAGPIASPGAGITLGGGTAGDPAANGAGGTPAAAGAGQPGGRRARGRKSRRDDGSIAIETAGLLPLLVGVLLLAWQLGIYGMSAIWAGQAASVAARAASVGADVQSAARQRVPDGVGDRVSVSSSASSVTATVQVPLYLPTFGVLPRTLSSTRAVVAEP